LEEEYVLKDSISDLCMAIPKDELETLVARIENGSDKGLVLRIEDETHDTLKETSTQKIFIGVARIIQVVHLIIYHNFILFIL